MLLLETMLTTVFFMATKTHANVHGLGYILKMSFIHDWTADGDHVDVCDHLWLKKAYSF